jgi:hypothetical protein
MISPIDACDCKEPHAWLRSAAEHIGRLQMVTAAARLGVTSLLIMAGGVYAFQGGGG